jgi:hypothetical protein
MYRQIGASDWAGVPPGAVQLMMLGDHDYITPTAPTRRRCL